MAEKEYTWDDLTAAIGQDFSGGVERTGIEPVEWSSIRRFCEPLELDCPIHYDEEVARAHGHRGVVAPISGISSTFTSQGAWRPGDPTRWPLKDAHGTAVRSEGESAAPPLPAPPTTAQIATDIEIEYFEPVCVGDRLTSKGRKLVSVRVRETSIGFGAFTVFESEIHNQRGELVAKVRRGWYDYNPHPPEKLKEGRGEPLAGQTREFIQLADITADWSNQRYWDDVKEGDEIPPVTFNITVQRLVIEAGGNRDFSPWHHDTVLTQRQGVEEMFANNVFVQGMWERTVREYIGLAGRIKKVGPLRMRIFNHAGMTVVTKGKVIRRWHEDGQNFVELEVWSENDRGVSVGPGPVLVTLPTRGS